MERMMIAYGQLYEIENGLRELIRHKMAEAYGPLWYHTAHRHVHRQPPKKPHFGELHFHELEYYLHVYPCFSVTHSFLVTIRELYPIRNKIAHCKKLTDEEFSLLTDAHALIMETILSGKNEIGRAERI